MSVFKYMIPLSCPTYRRQHCSLAVSLVALDTCPSDRFGSGERLPRPHVFEQVLQVDQLFQTPGEIKQIEKVCKLRQSFDYTRGNQQQD